MSKLTMNWVISIIEEIRQARSLDDLEVAGIKVGTANLSPLELRMVELAAQRRASMLVQNYG